MAWGKLMDALNRISEKINAEYGYRDNIPRINLGPCGRFAKSFYTIWNLRFPEKVTICFLFPPGHGVCDHVCIKLPDGNYFDGGYGVVPALQVQVEVPAGTVIQEMTFYDENELEKHACGLNREYPNCPGYNDEKVRTIIESCLDPLTIKKSNQK
jgi:hypothetical protein